MRNVEPLQLTRRALIGLGLATVGVATALPGYAQGAKKTLSYTVAIDRTAPGMQMTINGSVWVTASQARREMKDPVSGEQTTLITNGFVYMLEKKSKKGIRAPLPPDVKARPDNFEFFLREFTPDASGALKDAKKLRTETVSGISCDVLTSSLTKGEATRKVTIWMPQKQSPAFPIKVLQEDKFQKPGATLTESLTITLSNVKLGADIPASVFAVPTGYKIEAAKPRKPGAAPGPRPGTKKK